MNTSNNSTDNRFMEFRIGTQLFAVPLLSVKEVIQKPEVTVIPNMPSHFEGMVNLRGQILGVFNVRRKLSVKSIENTGIHSEVVIIVEQGGVHTGMIVDEVTRVLHAEEGKIGPAPLKEDDPASKFITSVIQTGDELVQTIDVGQLLEMSKFNVSRNAG